jgi:hypothetical protein
MACVSKRPASPRLANIANLLQPPDEHIEDIPNREKRVLVGVGDKHVLVAKVRRNAR